MKSFTDPEWYAPSFRCPILASKSTIWTGHRHEFVSVHIRLTVF